MIHETFQRGMSEELEAYLNFLKTSSVADASKQADLLSKAKAAYNEVEGLVSDLVKDVTENVLQFGPA